MVTHLAKTGEVIPLPEGITVPLIRIGALDASLNIPTDGLLRIANPLELLRAPVADTINFGYLQTTNTQKALFLTPAYQKLPGNPADVGKLLSKTPPLFADAYRIMSSKGIFPNVGDAITNFGDAIVLNKKSGTAFWFDDTTIHCCRHCKREQTIVYAFISRYHFIQQ